MSHKNKRLLVTAVLLILTLAITSPTFAHEIILLTSDPANGDIIPASPPILKAIFNEEMDTQQSTIQVFDSSGSQVDAGDGGVDLKDPNHATLIATLPPLPEGAYLVKWRIILLDGDPVEGQYNFFVGTPAAAEAANFAPIPKDAMITFTTAELTPEKSSNTTLLLFGGALTLVLASIIVIMAMRKSRG
ncbi:MAG: copper resistance protein CopC [Candidatus Promineifilaceae bacterium]